MPIKNILVDPRVRHGGKETSPPYNQSARVDGFLHAIFKIYTDPSMELSARLSQLDALGKQLFNEIQPHVIGILMPTPGNEGIFETPPLQEDGILITRLPEAIERIPDAERDIVQLWEIDEASRRLHFFSVRKCMFPKPRS